MSSSGFIMVPKKILADNYSWSQLSFFNKFLFILMIDRRNLSIKNGWIDADGTYIYFSIEEIKRIARISQHSAIKWRKELVDSGMIRIKRQGLGKPDKIYINEDIIGQLKAYAQASENHTSGGAKIAGPDIHNPDANNTDNNNTDFSENEINQSNAELDDFCDAKKEIMINIDYGGILSHFWNNDQAKQILDIIVCEIAKIDCATEYLIEFGGSNTNRLELISKLYLLDYATIIEIITRIIRNSAAINQIEQYVQKALLNAINKS